MEPVKQICSMLSITFRLQKVTSIRLIREHPARGNIFRIHGAFQRKADFRTSLAHSESRGIKKQFGSIQGFRPAYRITSGSSCGDGSPYDRDLIMKAAIYEGNLLMLYISQFDKAYLDSLIRYNRLLEQRMGLLKQFAERRQTTGALLLIDAQDDGTSFPYQRQA